MTFPVFFVHSFLRIHCSSFSFFPLISSNASCFYSRLSSLQLSSSWLGDMIPSDEPPPFLPGFDCFLDNLPSTHLLKMKYFLVLLSS